MQVRIIKAQHYIFHSFQVVEENLEIISKQYELVVQFTQFINVISIWRIFKHHFINQIIRIYFKNNKYFNMILQEVYCDKEKNLLILRGELLNE